LDRAVLEALITKFGGGPVGLSTLAIAVGEETETVETVAEPYLVREGLLGRTPRGRIALAPAWTHLGFAVPAGVFGQDPLEVFQPGHLDGDLGEEADPGWLRNGQ
jgi:Holliday junction DNA helicase RuvB